MPKTFEDNQDGESVKSIKSFEEGEVKSTRSDIEEEEKTLEREIVLLKRKLKEEDIKHLKDAVTLMESFVFVMER